MGVGWHNRRDFFALILVRLQVAVFTLGADALIAYWLGPEGKGLWYVVLEVVFIFSIICAFGQHYVLNRISHQDLAGFREYHSQVISVSLWVYLLLVVLITSCMGLVYISRPEWIGGVSAYALVFLTALIFLEAYLTILCTGLSTLGFPIQHFKLRVVRRAGIFLCCLALVFADIGGDAVTSLAMVFFCTALLTIVWGHLANNISFPSTQFKPNISLIKQGLSALPGDIVERRQAGWEVLVVGAFGLFGLAGNYSVALIMCWLFTLLGQAAQQYLLSQNTNEEERKYVTMSRVNLAVYLVLLPLVGGAAHFIVLPMVYGDEFNDAITMTWMLLPGAVFGALISSVLPIFVQRGKYAAFSYIATMFLIIRIVVAVCLCLYQLPYLVPISFSVFSALCWFTLVNNIARPMMVRPADFFILRLRDLRAIRSLLSI